MNNNPISIRLTADEIECLDAMATHLTHKLGHNVGRGQAIRHLLKRATPSADLNTEARNWRIAHHKTFGPS